MDHLLCSRYAVISEASGTLRTCGAQRVSFGDETTTGVDHKLASVGVIASVDQLSSFTWRFETHRKIRKKFPLLQWSVYLPILP